MADINDVRADAKAFEARKLADSAHPLQPGEFFCFRCKAPRKPAFGLVTYNPLTPYRGFLTAFCEDCEADCRRFIGRADLPAWGRLCRIDGTIVPQD